MIKQAIKQSINFFNQVIAFTITIKRGGDKMGVFYESLTNKKLCTYCGCYLDSDDTLCVCCLDELYRSEPEDEESLYPNLILTIANESEKFKEILDKRIESLKVRENETPEERSLRILRENSFYGFGGYGLLKSIGAHGE